MYFLWEIWQSPGPVLVVMCVDHWSTNEGTVPRQNVHLNQVKGTTFVYTPPIAVSGSFFSLRKLPSPKQAKAKRHKK